MVVCGIKSRQATRKTNYKASPLLTSQHTEIGWPLALLHFSIIALITDDDDDHHVKKDSEYFP